MCSKFSGSRVYVGQVFVGRNEEMASFLGSSIRANVHQRKTNHQYLYSTDVLFLYHEAKIKSCSGSILQVQVFRQQKVDNKIKSSNSYPPFPLFVPPFPLPFPFVAVATFRSKTYTSPTGLKLPECAIGAPATT